MSGVLAMKRGQDPQRVMDFMQEAVETHFAGLKVCTLTIAMNLLNFFSVLNSSQYPFTLILIGVMKYSTMKIKCVSLKKIFETTFVYSTCTQYLYHIFNKF